MIKPIWPQNNRPSKRHVWRTLGTTMDRCERCGAMHSYKAMGTTAIHCYPKPEWLTTHPNDDGKAGP